VPIVPTIVAIIVTSGLVALVTAFLIGRTYHRRASQVARHGNLAKTHHPCYRCGEVEGDAEYMGLHYCKMCRMVVSTVYACVRHDPPFGFPGAAGYLDFPEKGAYTAKDKKKKEA
jgi:hypothetical protein